jgi:hypothetical protein
MAAEGGTETLGRLLRVTTQAAMLAVVVAVGGAVVFLLCLACFVLTRAVT